LAVEQSDKNSSESIESWVIESRLRQGLPPHIVDVAVLLQLVELLQLRDDGTEDPQPQDGQR
jgi:hypothetical protein